MAFYPFSILSYVPLGIAYAVMLLFYGFLWWFSSAMKARAAVRVVGGFVLLLFPVSEELWIAWNFARACESAGTFVSEKIIVDGFYDSTRETHAGPRNPDAARDLDRGGYRFYEMVLRDMNGGPNRVVHLEKSDDGWRAAILDRPTARYQFRYTDPPNGTPWAHKIVRSGSVVVNEQTNKEIARYVSFGRGAPWFFIGHERPSFACDAPGRWPYARNSRLVYREALMPSARK